MTNQKSLYGLPEKVEFCTKCVISNQRPASTVEMNSDGSKKLGIQIREGVCDACRFAETKEEIDWDARSEAFMQMLEPYRSKDGSHDVIVPSSGGKDSSFTAHVLKYKYGMNPLAVTWAPNMFTGAGWSNFNNLTRTGGVDSILVTPNGDLHRQLTKLAFLNLGHPFQPFIHGQKVIGPAMAEKFGIKLVVYGENQAEYGNPIEDNSSPFMTPDFFTSENPADMLFGGRSVKDILHSTNFKYGDFAHYIPLTEKRLVQSEIKMTYLGFFEKWDPQEVYYYAVENTGFRPSDDRSEGTYSRYTEIDDKIVPFHFYTTFIKFGIGRATYDACQEIRNGHIDREEAIQLVRKYDGELPVKWLDDFLEYIQIERGQFDEVIDAMRSPHLWRKDDLAWQLLQKLEE